MLERASVLSLIVYHNQSVHSYQPQYILSVYAISVDIHALHLNQIKYFVKDVQEEKKGFPNLECKEELKSTYDQKRKHTAIS